MQDTRKLCSRRGVLPGEPGALCLPSLAPANVCTSRPGLPLQVAPSAPFRGAEDPAWHTVPAALCLVCLAAFTSVTLNRVLFPHMAAPLPMLFPLPGLPFFMLLPISYRLFNIQLRCHLGGAFPETAFPLTGPVAPQCSHHPPPFSVSVCLIHSLELDKWINCDFGLVS